MFLARVLLVLSLLLSTTVVAQTLDARCIPHLRFAYTIVVARHQGSTEEQILESFDQARAAGIFGQLRDSEVALMKRIVHLMFTGPVDNDEQIKALLIEAQRDCVTTLFSVTA